MEFETVERCGRTYATVNGVESECFARLGYGNHWLVYCPALRGQVPSLEKAMEIVTFGMGNWHTATEAAEALVEMGIFDEPPSAQLVTRWCREGLLPGAFKLLGRGARGSGGSWRIPGAALRAFAERRKEQ